MASTNRKGKSPATRPSWCATPCMSSALLSAPGSRCTLPPGGALILLTSARNAARADEDGALVLLADQDRSRWDRRRLDEGRSLAEAALAQHRPGPYQLQAAIAACHADAVMATDTDWRQIAALYSELLRFDPSPVIEANRAIAVAYAEGSAAGLAILDTLTFSWRARRVGG